MKMNEASFNYVLFCNTNSTVCLLLICEFFFISGSLITKINTEIAKLYQCILFYYIIIIIYQYSIKIEV